MESLMESLMDAFAFNSSSKRQRIIIRNRMQKKNLINKVEIAIPLYLIKVLLQLIINFNLLNNSSIFPYICQG